VEILSSNWRSDVAGFPETDGHLLKREGTAFNFHKEEAKKLENAMREMSERPSLVVLTSV
jgi:hypothetical protein